MFVPPQILFTPVTARAEEVASKSQNIIRLTKTSFLFSQVFDDCHWAIRLNENSFKARLYRAKAHKELEDTDKYEECRKELDEMFPQHEDLIKYFLDKKEGYDDDEEN